MSHVVAKNTVVPVHGKRSLTPAASFELQNLSPHRQKFEQTVQSSFLVRRLKPPANNRQPMTALLVWIRLSHQHWHGRHRLTTTCWPPMKHWTKRDYFELRWLKLQSRILYYVFKSILYQMSHITTYYDT